MRKQLSWYSILCAAMAAGILACAAMIAALLAARPHPAAPLAGAQLVWEAARLAPL